MKITSEEDSKALLVSKVKKVGQFLIDNADALLGEVDESEIMYGGFNLIVDGFNKDTLMSVSTSHDYWVI